MIKLWLSFDHITSMIWVFCQKLNFDVSNKIMSYATNSRLKKFVVSFLSFGLNITKIVVWICHKNLNHVWTESESRNFSKGADFQKKIKLESYDKFF